MEMMKEIRYLCSFNDFNIMKVVTDKKLKAVYSLVKRDGFTNESDKEISL